MNSDTRNQFQLPDSQFSGSGNQSFLSQAAYQSFPNNMGMLPQQVQYSNMMSPMQQQNPLPDSNSSTQHLGMQSMNGMQQFQFPGQMNAHLLQSQASQLLNSNQFRPAQDWRSMLSAPDRQHVINQLYNTISAQIQRAQQGNPNGTHNQGRAEGLARSVEQHIYESANSRANYLQKITEQLASLNRSNLDPAMTISALRQDAQQPPENGSAQDPGSPQKRNVNPQENQNQFGNYFQEQGSNTAGRVTRSMQNQKGQSVSLEDTSSSGQRKQSFGDQSQPQTPAPTPPNQAPSPKKDHSVKEDDSSQKQEGPQTTIAGMRVTLLTLTQEEKDSVVAKLEQIRPTYLRIDALIKTLLGAGGNSEFEKVRKLTGMKQMIGAQLDVLEQDIYFIRPDVLQQLLPSLNQYFRYAELLINGQQPRSVQVPGTIRPPVNGGQMSMMPSPMMQNGMMVGGQPNPQNGQPPGGSPHLTPNISGSPSMRPNMMGQPRPQMGQPRPMMGPNAQAMQANQHIQQLHSRLLNIQQQLQQIQQMTAGGVPPEQLQMLQLKQAELLQSQELMQQQIISLQQFNMMQRGNGNSMRPVRPMGMMVGGDQQQMPQQYGQMQSNAAAIANQRALQQQMLAQQQQMMGRGQPMPPRVMNPMLQQQRFMQQQAQFQEMMSNTGDSNQASPNFGHSQNESFQGSPQVGANQPQKGSPPQSQASNVKTPPGHATVKKESTPQITPNVPQISTSNQNQSNTPNLQQTAQTPLHPGGLQTTAQMPNMGMNAMSPNMAGVGQQMHMNVGMRPGMMPGNMMMNQMGRPFNPQFMNQQTMNMNQAALQQMAQNAGMPAQMFMQQQMMNQIQEQQQSNFENQIQRPGSAAGKKPSPQGAPGQMTAPIGMPQAMQGNPQFFVNQGKGPQMPPGMAPSPFAQQPPIPSPTVSQGPKSAGENWADDFNFGTETPTNTQTNEVAEDTNLEDYFNLDYEPPEFDTLQEPNVGEADFMFEVSPPAKKAAKRSRDDDQDDDVEKKLKFENILEKELQKLTQDYPVTFSTNTPQSSSSSVMVSFTLKSVSFSISIQNRSLYESGLSKGLLSFSTTQVPDKLSGLITDHISPTSTSRVTDIVKIIVAAVKE